MKGFPAAARRTLRDSQLRRNLGKATTTIRAKRLNTIAELDDWEALREAGSAIKAHAMATLPAQLERLEAVQGLELVDMEEPQECCGFGGTFAVKNADTSMAMLSDKLRRILDTRAEVCTAADNSCLMHIGGALRKQRTGVRAMHLAEILAATA